MSTRICLVRHGETAWNAERRLQGHIDIPLNDKGHAQARATARFPGAYQRFEDRDPDFVFPDGGESLQEFAARIRDVLNRIAQAHRGGQVLVVTHGGVLDIAHRMATGKPLDAPRDFTIPNAALNWIEWNGKAPDDWTLLAWARQEHLSDALDELPNS